MDRSRWRSDSRVSPRVFRSQNSGADDTTVGLGLSPETTEDAEGTEGVGAEVGRADYVSPSLKKRS
jgi:hypothetical protein